MNRDCTGVSGAHPADRDHVLSCEVLFRNHSYVTRIPAASSMRRPAERRQAARVEQLTRRAVRLRSVILQYAGKSDDPRHGLGKLGNCLVTAPADIDGLFVLVTLHQKKARIGNIFDVEELPAWTAASPDYDFRRTAGLAVLERGRVSTACRCDARPMAEQIRESGVRPDGASTLTGGSGNRGMHRQERDRHIVEDLRHRLPERQWRNVLGVQRYDDGIARLDRLARATEPARSGIRHHAAVRPHHVDPAVIRAARLTAAHGNVVTASQTRLPQM